MKRGLSVGVAALVAGVAFGGNTYEGGITFPADIPAAGEFGMDHGHAVLSSNGADSAVLDASGAEGVAVEAPLTDLVFDTADGCVSGEFADGVTRDTFLPAQGIGTTAETQTGVAIKYWKNRSLADIKSLRAIINYGGAHVENIARTCYFRNDGQTATVQFQSRMQYERPFENLICCKVEFWQDGADISAKIAYTGYINNKRNDDEAYDFDRNGYDKGQIYDKVLCEKGYGIRAIEAGEIGPNGKGGKGVVVRGSYAPLSPTRKATENLPRWTNLKLSDVEGFFGEIYAGSAWEWARAWFLRPSVDGQSMTAIFERYTDLGSAYPYISCAFVRFRQDGNDITLEHIDSGHRYLYASDDSFIPYDANNKSYQSNDPYELRNVTPVLKREKAVALNGMLNVAGPIAMDNANVTIGSAAFALNPVSRPGPVITGTGVLRYYRDVANVLTQHQGVCFGPAVTNTYSGMTIFDGASATFKGELAVSKNVRLLVLTNGATVATNIDGDKHLTQNGQGGFSVFLYPGSTFRMGRTNNLASDPHFYMFGGKVELADWFRYCGNILLSDGAQIRNIKTSGLPIFRLGNEMTIPMVISLGSGSNEIQAEIQLYGHKMGNANRANDCIRFYTEADLLISGNLKLAGDGEYQALRIRKAGSATLTLSGSNNHTSNWAVVGGTLNLASASAMTVQNGVTLDGGNLKTSAASVCAFLETSNTVANVEFAQGGSLTLADASALKIGAGGLTVSGVEHPEDGIPLRVGESACLSPAQLRSIRCLTPTRRLRVYQRDDGYLAASIGCVLILR